jgi:hypothetical protein
MFLTIQLKQASQSLSKYQLDIMKAGMSFLNSTNQDISPSVGNLQLQATKVVKELTKISTPKKSKLSSPIQHKSKAIVVTNATIKKELKL